MNRTYLQDKAYKMPIQDTQSACKNLRLSPRTVWGRYNGTDENTFFPNRNRADVKDRRANTAESALTNCES